MLDDNRKVLRIHPNRYSRNTYVGPDKPLTIPDSPKFSLVANAKGVDEVVECYLASKDLLNDVPPEIGKIDLMPLVGLISLDQLRRTFEKTSQGPMTTVRFVIAGARRD